MVLLDIRIMVLRCCILGGDHAHLAFVMTINKAQGQSITNIAIDLHTPVFSHGQLYIALSHCTSSHRIKVLFPEDSDIIITSTTKVLAGMINPYILYFHFVPLPFLPYVSCLQIALG